MNAPRIRAVLVDLDGTLVDSNEAHVDVWAQVFADAGHSVAREAIRGQIGKGGDLLVPTLLPDLPRDEQKQLSTQHGEVFKADRLATIEAFPDGAALVRRVHARGAKVVIASSASREELDHYCQLLGIGELVDSGTTIDDVDTSKPAADVFSIGLEKVGVAPADALVLGDTPYDIDAAAKAEIRAVAVRSGGFSDDALAGAIAIYDDVAALLAKFEASPLGW